MRLIEPPFLTSTGHHYKIKIWPGTTEKVGTGQSRQQKQRGYFSMQKVSFRDVLTAFYTNMIEIRTRTPASRCVVQDCNNGSNTRQGISVSNSPLRGSVLSNWRFVSSHRKNFKPSARFVVCSAHFTDDCFPGLIMSKDLSNALNWAQPEVNYLFELEA